MKQTSIIVPCYNEEERLPSSEFEEFSRQNRHIRFIFVNDASTDGTLGVINRLCDRISGQGHCVNLKSNLGKAGAVREGFLSALSGTTEYIGYWDADLSTPLREINSLIAPMEAHPDIEIVMASRVQLLGRKIERKRTRHYFGRLFATLASIVLDLKVYDTQCGAKIFRRERTLEAVFSLPFQVKWTFDVEILARYLVLGRGGGALLPLEKRIIEYPLMEWMDVPGSKVKLRDAFVAFRELQRVYSLINCRGGARHRKALLQKS